MKEVMGEGKEYFGRGKGEGAYITSFEISRHLPARLCYRNIITIKKLELSRVGLPNLDLLVSC